MPEEEGERAPARGGNFLTRKVGPLPMWGWIAAVGVGAAVFIYRKKAAASTAATASTGATAAPGASTAAPDVFGASGYSGGQQTGGYDSSSSDSFLQQLQGQLSTIQSGVQLSPNGVGQVQGVVSTTAPPVAVPNPANAPVQAANPIAAAIEAQYQNELGRASDPGGASFWQQEYITKGPTVEAQEFAAAAQKEKGQH